MKKKEYRYRIQHVCFECRKVFKIDFQSAKRTRQVWLSQRISGRRPSAPFVEPQHPCPQCSRPLHLIGRAFRAPKLYDDEGWRAAALLYDGGFRFWSSVGPLPTTVREAKVFVQERRPRSPGAKLAERIQAESQ